MKPIDKAKLFISLDKTISELSFISNVPAGSISDFKNGRRDLETARYETISKLSEAYDKENNAKLDDYKQDCFQFINREVNISELRDSSKAIVRAATTGQEVANALEMLSFYMMDNYKPDDVFERLKELSEKGKTWK